MARIRRTCPYLGMRFWPLLSHFWANCPGHYYLSIGGEKSLLRCLFFIFWATFGEKMGVAITRAPNGLGHLNPIKKLAHWVDLLGLSLSGNYVFEIIRSEPPSPLRFSYGKILNVLHFLILQNGKTLLNSTSIVKRLLQFLWLLLWTTYSIDDLIMLNIHIKQLKS